jgi:hypothetical protein
LDLANLKATSDIDLNIHGMLDCRDDLSGNEGDVYEDVILIRLGG